MNREASATRRRRAAPSEPTVVWLLWGLLAVAMLVTYTRLDPGDLYHVSRDGLVGGLSRVLVAINFPISLVAIALVVIAMDSLPRRAWWFAAPAVALCAVTVVPGVVDDGDLDARPINLVPALGVLLAVGLAVAAARRAAPHSSERRSLDPARWGLIVVVAVLSLPWIFAELGFYVPEWLFIAERPIVGSDGKIGPAVHLGHHHGFDGALFVISVALLSRVRIRSDRLATASNVYLAALLGYGAVNFGQDVWNEQLWKRGVVEWSIPSAYNPALKPIWLVVALLAVLGYLALRVERGRSRSSRPEGDFGPYRNGELTRESGN